MGLIKESTPPTKWIKAENLADVPQRLTISAITTETWQDGRTQFVLCFDETPLMLGLNKTNLTKLAEMYGHQLPDGSLDVEEGELIGQQIALYKSTTQNQQGMTVPCVRIREPKAARPAAPNGQAPANRPVMPNPAPSGQAPADYRPQGMATQTPEQQRQALAREMAKGNIPATRHAPQVTPPEPGETDIFDDENDYSENALPGMAPVGRNTAHTR